MKMEFAVINSLALFLGSIAVASTAIPSLFGTIKALKADPHGQLLEITLPTEVFVIDPGAIDTEDPEKIERAVEALDAAIQSKD